MAATVLICSGLFIGFVASGSNNVTVYTQRDFFKYHTLTDTDIENARVSRRATILKPIRGTVIPVQIASYLRGRQRPYRCVLISKNRDTRSKNAVRVRRRYDQLDGALFCLCFNPLTRETELTNVLNN